MPKKLKTLLTVAAFVLGAAMLPVGTTSATSKSTVYLPDGKYYLQNQNSKYLRVSNSNVDVSTLIGWQANEIYLTRGGDGFYTIRSVAASKNVDVYGAYTWAGANVGMWTPNNSCAQKWAVDSDDAGFYHFRNACSGKALDVSGASNLAGANVQIWDQNNSAAQRWRAIRTEKVVADDITSGQNWRISSRADDLNAKTSRKYSLDVNGGWSRNGTNIQTWSNNISLAQAFRFEKNQDGSVRIKNIGSNKSVDVSGAGRNQGTNVQLWDSNNTCAQKWFVEWSWEHGTYRFLNACSGLALDVNGGTARNGTNVQVWGRNNTDAQEWYLQRR